MPMSPLVVLKAKIIAELFDKIKYIFLNLPCIR